MFFIAKRLECYNITKKYGSFIMQLKTQLFVLSLLSFSIQQVMAADDTNTKDEKPAELATIKVKAEPVNNTSLTEGATSIGNALNGQAGVYAAQYTGGASRPVIRGQDGTRVKIVQNGGDVMDVSSVSPDHAVTVDPNSAQDIQILNGAEALLYGAGSVGGLVNVVDEKIPTSMPDKGYQGKAGVRYNSGSDELLYSGQATVGLGDHVALRVGGLKRDANDYILPKDLQTDERRQDSTFAESKNYNAGLSWIGDRGFIGASFSQRHDQYGIPADNELFGSCERDGLHLVCGAGDSTDHEHDHEHDASWINLKEKRYDLKGELKDPFAGFAKVAAQASYTDYQHEEMHNTDVGTTFKSKGIDSRVTLENNAWAGWTGQIGAQYTQQKLNIVGDESIMDPSKTQRYSVFGLQQKQINNVNLAVSSRIDHQTIDIESDQKNYTGTGYSVAGTASWEFIPQYKLSFTTSHQERLPFAQELYSDGVHMATNTYELGNDDLKKERSNNVELGLHFDNDLLKYNVSVFHNRFDNFIYANTLDEFQGFRLIEYSQDAAKFYGVDADLSYQISPVYNLGLFGDYVRGKIDNENAPRIPGGRLGTKVKADFGDGWDGSAEYYHVFKQDDIANYETKGQSYNMLNLGVGYNGKYSNIGDYRVFLNANNLLDSKIYQHESFLANVPQVGRNFTVGVNFSF